MPPPLARQFYDRVVGERNSVAAIRALVITTDPQFERYWIDFKGEEQPEAGWTPRPAEQDTSTRDLWSKNLSAFADTGGGVMLWGLDARSGMVEGREIACVLGGSLLSYRRCTAILLARQQFKMRWPRTSLAGWSGSK